MSGMSIENAKSKLQAAMSGPAGRYWNYTPAVTAVLAALEQAEKRIAELEVRVLTVKLPESVIDAICHTAAEVHNQGRGVSDERAQDIINSIRCAAGISLKIEGE